MKDSKKAKTWYIRDEYGKVDLRFEIDNVFCLPIRFLVVNVYYALPFGRIYGKVVDTEGRVYNLSGAYGIGEDKTTRM